MAPLQDARLDLKRRQRLGMVEAVWGEHKTADQIIAILECFAAAGELGLVTRVDPDKAAAVQQRLPAVQVHPQARCLSLGTLPQPPQARRLLPCSVAEAVIAPWSARPPLPCRSTASGSTW